MKTTVRSLAAMVSVCLGLVGPMGDAFADSGSQSESLSGLTAKWWQWALSIPTSVNPMLDTTGENCMIGQRGKVWFLSGVFGGGTADRTCSIPENATVFFPVKNSVNFNTPNVCGQDGKDIPIAELRAGSAGSADNSLNLLVELDGKPVKDIKRIQSTVFPLALPEDNVFNPCIDVSNLPAGVYSPAVDDGYYVTLKPLKPGMHMLHFHADRRRGDNVVVSQEITYHLNVVPVLRK